MDLLSFEPALPHVTDLSHFLTHYKLLYSADMTHHRINCMNKYV